MDLQMEMKIPNSKPQFVVVAKRAKSTITQGRQNPSIANIIKFVKLAKDGLIYLIKELPLQGSSFFLKKFVFEK
jgi:hypothetical protein